MMMSVMVMMAMIVMMVIMVVMVVRGKSHIRLVSVISFSNSPFDVWTRGG